MPFKFNDPIVGGTVLRIPAIQSPGFVTGVTGWKISIDGSAQFNNLTIRGQFFGTDFIINAAGIFFYSGTPAAGNLILAIAQAAGSDTFLNPYTEGLTLGNAAGIQVLLRIISGVQAAIQFPTNNVNENVAANVTANVIGSGLTAFLQLVLSGPKTNVTGAQDWTQILFNSANFGNTSDANLDLNYVGSGGGVHQYASMDATGFNIMAGSIVAAHPGSTPLIPETWENLTLLNNYTAGANPGGFLDVPQIRMDADNQMLHFKGTIVTPNPIVSPIIAAVPVGYPNANLGGNYGMGTPIINHTAGATNQLRVQNNGNISFQVTPGVNFTFDMTCQVITQ